ncbi:TadE family protein [Castellaniella sp.]|uniref:TadE family protein n=1 Tax=Castellaniella sp. TaxID=1955812 RepID=UPI000EB84690|nr:pilus assembly protein TadG [Comamonadaceae bacterium]
MTLRPDPVMVRPARPHGIASIEFAFVLVTLALILYALATFATVFYTQQALARAVEDGARAALRQKGFVTATPSDLADAEANVLGAVHDSLARSLIVPNPHASTEQARHTWVQTHVTVQIERPTASAVTVRVSYPYRGEGNPFPSVPLLDAASWIPDALNSHATAALVI